MVKEAKVGNVTAAIGDGGNDISMIQEAHVGLGIIGLEGNAAAKAADFAFTKVAKTRLLGPPSKVQNSQIVP